MDTSQFAKYTRVSDSKDYYCKKDYCVDGVHTPQQCQQSAKCATLLASYPGAFSNFQFVSIFVKSTFNVTNFYNTQFFERLF